MSLEAIGTLTAVEERLKKLRTDAAASAKQSAAEARAAGERLVEEAVRKAESEIGELTQQTDAKAKAAAEALAESSEQRREELRAGAKAKEAEAVSFVIERIVNG